MSRKQITPKKSWLSLFTYDKIYFMKNNIEIMAPAGSFDALAAAINACADSVYFGAGNLNMRARSSANFSLDDINAIAEKCKGAGIKSYLVLNTLIYDNELEEIKKICDAAKSADISAVIASDISVIQYARSVGLPVHISVQANVSNIEAVKFYSKFAEVIVLARELSLSQIKNIIQEIKREKITAPNGEPVKIEIFAHGALCVAISGKCYMSLALYNKSANRGACYQPCRRSYKVEDEQTGDELVIDNKYIMSPKDLCTITFLDSILDAGVEILKIEGRGRSADYVATTVKAYKEAAALWQENKFSAARATELAKNLENVFNRGFWQGGYYLGEPLGEWSGQSGSKAKFEKKHIGVVTNYFSKIGVAEISLTAGQLNQNDKIIFIGPTTGALQIDVKEIRLNEKKTTSAKKGDVISLKVPNRVRRNDKVYLMMPRRFGEYPQ